jgi:hypothetical protein
MIRQSEAAAAVDLARLLTGAGVGLACQNGSPLDALRMATDVVTPVVDDSVETTLVNRTKSVVLGGSNEDGSPREIPSEHGWAKQRLVETLSAGVQKISAAAKSVVIPAIKTLHDRVDAYVDAKSDPSNVMPEVNVYVYDDIWASNVIDGVVNHYGNVNLVGMPIVQLPDLTDEQIAALTNSGSAELSAFASEQLAKNPDLARAIYQIWFQGSLVSDQDSFSFLSRVLQTNNTERNVLVFGNDALDTRRVYEPLVMAYLMADNLYNNPIPGTGLSDDRYAMVMSAFRAHFAKTIERIYKVRASNADRKMLVISMPVTDSWRVDGLSTEQLLLNGDVYQWYLQAGGSIEALLGNCFIERSVNGRTILDAKDRLEAEYARVGTLAKSIAVTSKHTLTIQGIMNAVDNYVVNEITDELWSEIYNKLSYTQTKADALADVRYYVSSIQSVATYQAVDDVLTYIVANMIYGPLNVSSFLNAMANYPDQTLSPREIAAHVEMDIVLDNLLQMTYYTGVR